MSKTTTYSESSESCRISNSDNLKCSSLFSDKFQKILTSMDITIVTLEESEIIE